MSYNVRAGKALLFCLFVLGGMAALRTAPAQQTAAAPAGEAGQTAGRATWDPRYLYLSFQIDDPALTGTNAGPLSRPAEDDSVGVYLQVGQGRPDTPDENTHAMLVSAAGGFSFLRGQGGKLVRREMRELISIKYAVTLQGTLNRPDDRDRRYTVEMAIPWELIGVKPGAGTTLGYNVVARARGGGFTALAAGVQTEADVLAPAKWTRLTLQEGPGGAPAGQGRFAPRVADAARTPLIDGALRAGEWPDSSLYAFAAPEKGAAPAAVAVTPVPAARPARAAPPLPLGRSLAVERLLMARYDLGFQGDSRKLTPFRGVRTPAGRFLLSDQPALGAGPWFSSDRTGWHRSQLAEMRRAGMDVALTVVGGPDASTGLGDEKALLVLVGALREMASERIPAPQLALWLDTTSLVAPGARKPDLTGAQGRALLYRAVRRWFQIVPPEFRASVQLPAGAGGVPAYPVFLSTAAGFSAQKGGWPEDLRRRFAADFGSDATLLVCGGKDFAGARLAAYLPVGTGGKGTGAITTYVVQPGYEDGAVAQRATLVPRRGGETYRQAWEAALAANPRWLVLDSWNDFARGTEVAPSRQYGAHYLDQTRIHAIQFNGLQPQDVKWLWHNAPRRMRPLQIVTVDVLLQNAGSAPLRPSDGAALSYRWLRQGKVVAESPLRVSLPGSLFPTQVARLPVGIAAVRAEGGEGKAPLRLHPLPPGEYVVQIDMIRKDKDGKPAWFGDNGDRPLSLAVTVAPDAGGGVTFESTTTPPLLQTGETYPVSVRLRWLGSDPLPADAAVLTWQLLSEDGTQTIGSGSSPLGQALPPGQMVTLRAPLRLADSGGEALPAAFPEAQGGGYRLRWLLTRTQATEAIPGVYTERVALYPESHQARILVPASAPTSMDADAVVPVEVTVVNRGPAKWAKNALQVGYHWYHPDGVEAVWKGGSSAPIAKEVEPGKSVKVSVPVRTPERDGEYVLAFDVAGDAGAWLSTQPVTRSGDLGLAYVRVSGQRLALVDLGRWYNQDATAPDGEPGDGDMDGKGGTLPDESIPPDSFGLTALAEGRKKNGPAPAYPSGYYADVSPTARLISFRYGPQTRGAKNAVACAGQVVPVPKGRYTGLHLAAAATGGEYRPLRLVLRYKDGSTQTLSRAVADWGRRPTDREPVAVLAHRKRTPKGDVAQVCALRHVIVPVSVGKELASVTLPDDAAIKVFAMTLER